MLPDSALDKSRMSLISDSRLCSAFWISSAYSRIGSSVLSRRIMAFMLRTVDGGADFMGHIGKKFTFCHTGKLCFLPRPFHFQYLMRRVCHSKKSSRIKPIGRMAFLNVSVPIREKAILKSASTRIPIRRYALWHRFGRISWKRERQ